MTSKKSLDLNSFGQIFKIIICFIKADCFKMNLIIYPLKYGFYYHYYRLYLTRLTLRSSKENYTDDQGRRGGGGREEGNLPRAPNLKGAPGLGANVKLSKAP